MRDTRMGIHYRAKPDGARLCAASDMRDTRMGIQFLNKDGHIWIEQPLLTK